MFFIHSVPRVPQLVAISFSLNNGPDVLMEIKTATEVINTVIFFPATLEEL